MFGEPTIYTGPGNDGLWRTGDDTTSSTSAVDNPYMFTGRRYDDETGLYYYRARYYKPDIGRFLQPDPIGYDDGLNLYTYVGNNPLGWTDPYGLCKGGLSKLDRFKIDFWNNVASGADWLHYRLGGDVVKDLEYLHYSRNRFNQRVTFNIAKDYWIQMSAKKSVYHRMGPGNENNLKFVSPDGMSEAIFRPDGTVVKDPVNMATYNFSSPNKYLGVGHFFVDVIPYYAFGNSPDDPTNFTERLTASYGASQN